MEDYRLEQSGQEVQDILDGAAMQSDLTAEKERAEREEQALQGAIDDEALARGNADTTLQGHIDDEEARAKAAEKQNADDIDAIEEKIPSGASAENKLATEDYVDDSVATASATFRGTYNLVTDLHMSTSATRAGIAAALGTAISGADNNDYAFVMIPTSEETPTEIARVERYKFNGTAWGFEYTLNNSGYTAAQWAAINSGITSGLVQKLGPLPSADDLAAALLAKQDVLTFDSAPTPESTNPVTSGGVYTAVDNEKGARQNADQQLQQAIEAILALIPSAATALNQLADKAFVNSSIATDTSTFRGTYNLVTDLHLAVNASHSDIATALLTAASSADNNDYCFVQVPTSVDTPNEIRVTERYKFDGTAWAYEYDLNNSGFTAQQWEAINSAITSALVSKLSALPTAAELATELAGKQAVLTFDNQPTSGSSNPVKSGGVYDVVAAINAKIPSDADAANKMTTEARIATIIGALDATFDLTSADGHITFKMTQTDGLIASVQILTYDIASAAALTTLGGRVSLNESDISNLQAAYAALTQSDIVIVNGALPSSGQQQNIIYRQPDHDHTPPQFYSDYMWNGTTWVLMAQYNNAIDAVPTAGSNNLVKSGGVFSSIAENLWIKGKYLDYVGNEASYELALCTPFLKAENGIACTGLVAFSGSGNAFIFFYDEDYNFIGNKTGELNVPIDYTLNTADFPSGTVYFRVHSIISNNPNVNNISDSIYKALSYNQNTKLDSWINGEYLDENGGIAYYEGVKRSNYIVVKEGIACYNLSAMTGSGNGYLFFYDKDLNYIGKLTGTPGNQISKIIENSDIPTGAKYFRCHTDIRNNAYITDHTPSIIEYFPQSEKDVCYVAPDGNDANSGSLGSPFATFQHAVDNGYKTIIGKAGYYHQFLSIDNKNNVKIICKTDVSNQKNWVDNVERRPRIILDNSETITGLELDTATNLYKVARTLDSSSKWYKVFVSHELPPESEFLRSVSYNAILWELTPELSGCKKMVPVLTLSDCQSTAGSFYCDGEYLYVHPTNELVEYRTIINETTEQNGIFISNSYNIELENVDILFSPYAAIMIQNSSLVSIRECDFGFTAWWSGLETRYSDVKVYNGNAFKARIDGFGSIGNGDLSLYGCNALYNYDDGVSHHYQTTGNIDGGKFIGNAKGGVCPSYGSRVNISNVFCKDNDNGIYLIQNPNESPIVTNDKLKVSNSVAIDNNTYDVKVDGYNAIIMNCGYHTSSFDTQKEIDIYNCNVL